MNRAVTITDDHAEQEGTQAQAAMERWQPVMVLLKLLHTEPIFG
jgi:hypothetical protein